MSKTFSKNTICLCYDGTAFEAATRRKPTAL